MRKLTATLFITLDGVVGGESEMEMWHFPYFNEELGQPRPVPTRRPTPSSWAA
jgi:hypothetical protein